MRKHLIQFGAAALAAPALALGATAAAGAADATHGPSAVTALTWTPLNLIDGWTALSASTYGAPSYSVQNGILYLRGILSASTAAGPEVAVLPSAARPSHYLWLTYTNFGGDNVSEMEIEPNGEIFIYGSAAGGPVDPSLAALSFPLSS